MDTQIDDDGDPQAVVRDNAISQALAAVPTRLAGFGELTEGRLINWGYALADVALRQRAQPPVTRAAGLPVPDAPLA